MGDVGSTGLAGLTGLAVLAAVILYLLRANAVYRKDYRADNDAWERRYNAEVEAGRLRLHTEVEAHERTQEMLDAERERRRQAENAAWLAGRSADQQIAKLGTEVTQLRDVLMGGTDDDEPH